MYHSYKFDNSIAFFISVVFITLLLLLTNSIMARFIGLIFGSQIYLPVWGSQKPVWGSQSNKRILMFDSQMANYPNQSLIVII